MSAMQGLAPIGQIAITVHDLERVVAFYRATLGMTFLFEASGRAFFKDLDGNTLALMSAVQRA